MIKIIVLIEYIILAALPSFARVQFCNIQYRRAAYSVRLVTLVRKEPFVCNLRLPFYIIDILKFKIVKLN